MSNNQFDPADQTPNMGVLTISHVDRETYTDHHLFLRLGFALPGAGWFLIRRLDLCFKLWRVILIRAPAASCTLLGAAAILAAFTVMPG
jgi:hypothetical protein